MLRFLFLLRFLAIMILIILNLIDSFLSECHRTVEWNDSKIFQRFCVYIYIANLSNLEIKSNYLVVILIRIHYQVTLDCKIEYCYHWEMTISSVAPKCLWYRKDPCTRTAFSSAPYGDAALCVIWRDYVRHYKIALVLFRSLFHSTLGSRCT